MEVQIRHVTSADDEEWLRMRCALWPDNANDHRAEIAEFLRGEASEPLAALLATRGTRAVGFAELSIRAYAEGCHSGNVAFLEGWYVEPDMRHQGVGRMLIAVAEEWGRSQGCTEFGSDARPDNSTSIAAHLALGFEDAGLVQCFRKDI